MDVPFDRETLQKRFKHVSIPPLEFEGSVISMPAQTNSERKRLSMGIAFIAKRKGFLKRESAIQVGTWKIIEGRHADVQPVDVHAK